MRVALLLALVLLSGCSTYRGAQHYQRGSIALERGEVARAIPNLERAAELVPHASEIRNHLGLAYAAAGRRADALEAFQRAVELDCANAAAVRNLSRTRADAW